MPVNLGLMPLWQTPLCPFAIEFAADKLDEVRIAVIDGFYAVPHGGVEVGGLLLGTYEKDHVRILDYRKIETEYLTGPSFSLSANDLAGLRTLLADPGSLEIVGWYHSHTRSSIHLSEKDLDLHREFFPNPNQIALVLRPENLGPVLAGYFFRDAEGNISAESSVLEFTLQPVFREVAEPEIVEEIAAVAEPLNQPMMFGGISTRGSIFSPMAISVLIILSLLAGAVGYWFATQG